MGLLENIVVTLNCLFFFVKAHCYMEDFTQLSSRIHKSLTDIMEGNRLTILSDLGKPENERNH